jgi:hypothetical protein
MAFQHLPDNRGMIYIPECPREGKKPPCRDCFSCQWCGDERCRACRGGKCIQNRVNNKGEGERK